ncbi:hypothetical protein Droror1_Dr00006396 [Drosera rotundifolia]
MELVHHVISLQKDVMKVKDELRRLKSYSVRPMMEHLKDVGERGEEKQEEDEEDKEDKEDIKEAKVEEERVVEDKEAVEKLVEDKEVKKKLVEDKEAVGKLIEDKEDKEDKQDEKQLAGEEKGPSSVQIEGVHVDYGDENEDMLRSRQLWQRMQPRTRALQS